MAEAASGPDLSLPTRSRARVAGDALIALVEAHLPQRVYKTDRRWSAYAAAMIVRMSDTLGSLLLLMDAGADGDGMIVLRALVEEIVVFCWVAIDPDSHLFLWIDNALYQRHKLHNDALAFGIELYKPDEVERLSKAKTLGALPDLAHAVDTHWGPRLQGFRTRAFDGSQDDMLTFRGMYMSVYRLASRETHAQPEALDDYADFAAVRIRIARPERGPRAKFLAVGISLFAQALIVCNDTLGWPDPARATSINNEMYEPRAADPL